MRRFLLQLGRVVQRVYGLMICDVGLCKPGTESMIPHFNLLLNRLDFGSGHVRVACVTFDGADRLQFQPDRKVALARALEQSNSDMHVLSSLHFLASLLFRGKGFRLFHRS